VVATDERGNVALEHRDRGNVDPLRGNGAHAAQHRRRREVHDIGTEVTQRVPDLAGGQGDGEHPVHRQWHGGDAHDRRAGVLGGSVARYDNHGVVAATSEMLQDAKHRVRHAVDLRKKALGDDSVFDAQHDESSRKRLCRATNTTSRSRGATVNEPRYRSARKRSPLVHPDADRGATGRSTVESTQPRGAPMTVPSPSFRCELRRENGSAAVIVDGELEEISAVQLAAACLHARDEAGDVVLDLGGVSFADGTGLKMLETIHRSFGRSGHRLTVAHASRRIRAEIELLGLDRILSIEADAEARAAAPFALTG
jgi:anti-anti-sigma factor